MTREVPPVTGTPSNWQRMNIVEFEARFPPQTSRLGTDSNRPDGQIWFFFDNGTDVGIWKYDKRTTKGYGEIIFGEDALMARESYKGRGRGR